MQEVRYFPFMDLPVELRCHVYSYLPDIAYDPVFFEPCICSWEVYRLPTALLQLNKTIYEEAKQPWIQKPLQNVNDQLPPKIVLGPTRTEIDSTYIALSDIFHQAGKKLHTFLGGLKEYGDEVENISLDLASWYNNTYLPRQVPSGHDEGSNPQNKCRPERLCKFVRQTLKRMTVRKTCEIRVRVLTHPLGPLPGGEKETADPPLCYMFYEHMAALDTERQALSVGMSRELQMVSRLSKYKVMMAPRHDELRMRGVNIKVAEVRKRDWGLLDMAMSFC